MEANDQTNKPFFSGVVIYVVYKYKKHLLIIGVLAILLSAIFSSPFFITPLYKSTVILYPTASKSISKVLLSDNLGNTKDILEFGEEEQTEQMLQILNSNKIRDKVIEKFNLLEHYNIPENSQFKFTKLYEEYESNFVFRRTEYMAVKITVYDSDAQMAAEMANTVAEYIDSTINQMQKEVARKAFQIVEKEYNSLQKAVQQKEDSLSLLRSYGVHDYESQSEMFNRQLAIEMARGNTDGVKRLEQKLDVIAKYGGTYVSLRDALEHDKKQLSEIKAKFDEAKVDANENLPHKFVVNSAYKAEKKSYPIRWLIVVISTLSVLFLAIVAFGMTEILTGEVFVDLKKKSLIPDTFKEIFVKKEKENEIRQEQVEQKKTQEEKKTENKIIQTETKSNKTQKEPETIKENTTGNTEFEMDKYFNSHNLLMLIEKWKYHLLIIVAASALLAAIFSSPFFITPMYKSFAIAYPANIEPYSDESETEQMLQIVNSHDIMDSVIKKFDLARHYKISPNYKYFQTVMYYEYKQNVTISKTPYESVLVEVMDKNPDTAARMAQAILDFYDKKIAYLHKTKYREVIEMYTGQLESKQKTLDSLKNIMYVLGTEYGIFEYGYQSQEILRAYLKTGSGGASNTKEAERLLKSMEVKSGLLVEVVQMIQNEAIAYVQVKQDFEMAKRFYESKMTYSNIVSKPFPADKKSYPVRWLIVVAVSLAAFAFSSVIILFIEYRNSRLVPVSE